LGLRSRRWSVLGLAGVQTIPGYRRVARRWLASRRADLRYLVRAPLHAGQKVELYRRLSAEEFAAIRRYPEAEGMDRWILSLFVGETQRPAASATLVARRVPGGMVRWEVSKVEVRVRYRGMGLDEVLLREAERILAQRKRGESHLGESQL
jgi:ribosomal protein S18 acetylase RimI-like enzyme